jgi:hypothetical protein
MAWLGEAVAVAAGPAPAPRCIKDLIEERLFERRRDLFTDLSSRCKLDIAVRRSPSSFSVVWGAKGNRTSWKTTSSPSLL